MSVNIGRLNPTRRDLLWGAYADDESYTPVLSNKELNFFLFELFK
jgi:hypothetical protein